MAVVILNKKPKPSKSKKVALSPIKDPKKIEYDARRTLKKLIEPMKADIQQIMNQMRDNPDIEMTTIGEQLEAMRKRYEVQFDNRADIIANNWVNEVNMANREYHMAELRKLLGVDTTSIVSEDIRKELDLLRFENASLIKTIPSEMVMKVSDRVLQHFKGIPMPEGRTLQAQIKEEFKVTDGRAKVLARDQTTKMNMSITSIRQQAIGIDMYIWKTVRDKRVVGAPGGKYKYNPKNDKHKNHYIMEGKVCRWDNPDVYSDDNGKTWKKRTSEMPHNHPGTDIMCRCRPSPLIDIEKLKVKWMI